MNMKSKKGFTLLEIIIVIIIVGVLASLALPKLFAQVEYSKSAEALNAFATLRSSLERCYIERASANCPGVNFENLDAGNPANSAGSHFNYGITGGVVTGDSIYTITATRTTYDNGTAGDLIVIQVDDSAGTISKSGTGAFERIQ